MSEEPSSEDEPDFAPWRVAAVEDVLERLPASREGPSGAAPRTIAVDGRSGAGKTTLATLPAGALPDAAVVHTDDVAWHHLAPCLARSSPASSQAPVRRRASGQSVSSWCSVVPFQSRRTRPPSRTLSTASGSNATRQCPPSWRTAG